MRPVPSTQKPALRADFCLSVSPLLLLVVCCRRDSVSVGPCHLPPDNCASAAPSPCCSAATFAARIASSKFFSVATWARSTFTTQLSNMKRHRILRSSRSAENQRQIDASSALAAAAAARRTRSIAPIFVTPDPDITSRKASQKIRYASCATSSGISEKRSPTRP